MPEDGEVLQAWMERFGLKYRGQRLAGATNDVFLAGGAAAAGADPGLAGRRLQAVRSAHRARLLQDLAGGYCHDLTKNRRSDERIFQFISWLRVGEAEEVPLAEAVRVARREFPRPPGTQGTFVRVVEADAERVTLDGGQQFTHAELLHAAVPRHHLCKLPGADAPRPRVVAGRGRAALQPAAPVRWRQPGY